MKKNISMLALMVVVAVVLQGGVVLADDKSGPAEIVLPAKMGAVTFPHLDHQAKVADCVSCHHQGVEAGSCSSCHGEIEGVPAAKDAFHKQCKGCHQKEAGPTSCKSCHVK